MRPLLVDEFVGMILDSIRDKLDTRVALEDEPSPPREHL